jgi:hypothetical protein
MTDAPRLLECGHLDIEVSSDHDAAACRASLLDVLPDDGECEECDIAGKYAEWEQERVERGDRD